MFLAEVRKKSAFFLSENFQFLEVKFSIYLNRRVFVMIYQHFLDKIVFLDVYFHGKILSFKIAMSRWLGVV